jgi:hypothetical protein
MLMVLFLFFQQGHTHIQGQSVDPGGPLRLSLEVVSAFPYLQTHFLVVIFEIFLRIGVGPANLDDYWGIRQNG